MIISSTVDDFILKYQKLGSPVGPHPSRFFSYTNEDQHNDGVFEQLLTQCRNALYEYLLFGFLSILQVRLCSYIDILDAEVKIATNDVLELPNYTLVIPMEVISALHQIILQRNWRTMVMGSTNTVNNPPTETYAKGILKFVSNKLGVPNLIVVDESKSTIWYKFQYMTQPQKIRFSAADLFVKTHLTRQQEQINKTTQYY